MTTPLFPATSFAEIEARLSHFPTIDLEAAAQAQARQDILTKPAGSLGRLENLAVFMAGWQQSERPHLDAPQVLVFAGNHGVCDKGVNVFPQTVTQQMVANFAAGGAAINQLAHVAGASLRVVALELDRPTLDLSEHDAMSESETLDAMAQGFEAVDRMADMLVLGEMGIGNTTVAGALSMSLFGGSPSQWVGPGTGADDAIMARKVDVLRLAEARLSRRPDIGPLDILASVGGREEAALCGAILAARSARIPVILDGFICTASAAVIHKLGMSRDTPINLLDHCIAGHVSAEPGHRHLLQELALPPLLQLDMRLGEGSGAAVALLVAKAAVATHNGMATFQDAGVSNR